MMFYIFFFIENWNDEELDERRQNTRIWVEMYVIMKYKAEKWKFDIILDLKASSSSSFRIITTKDPKNQH
jgi:hypothetical protein